MRSVMRGRLRRLLMGLILLLPALAATAQTALTPAFPVNLLAGGREGDSAIARNASGRTVIVWNEAGAIRGRRFDAAGAPLDDGFVVDPAGAGADVAIAADGAFIISWAKTDESRATLYQRYDADGQPVGAIGIVPGGTPLRRPRKTAVALDDQGRFAIAMVGSEAPRGIATGPFLLFPLGAGIVDLLYAPIRVEVAHFAADGRAIQSATLSRANELGFYLALQTLGGGGAHEGALPSLGGNVDIALDASGDAVVVWDTISGVGTTPLLLALGTSLGRVAGSVQARKLRRGAAQPGPQVTVDVGQSLVLESFDPGNVAFAPPPPKPSIVLRPDGGFLVVYALPMQFEIVPQPFGVDDRRGIDRQLRLKTLSPALLPQLQPTVVAPFAEAAAVAVDAGGNAVVAWEGPLPGPIRVQRFGADRVPLAAPVTVGSRDRSGFGLSTAPIGLGAAADGSFAISWQQRVPVNFTTLETILARVYTVP